VVLRIFSLHRHNRRAPRVKRIFEHFFERATAQNTELLGAAVASVGENPACALPLLLSHSRLSSKEEGRAYFYHHFI